MEDQEGFTDFQVVVNDEEQYSIWPVDRPVPNGWRAEGHTGSKDECLGHISKVWIDMRPLSVRSATPTEPDAGG